MLMKELKKAKKEFDVYFWLGYSLIERINVPFLNPLKMLFLSFAAWGWASSSAWAYGDYGPSSGMDIMTVIKKIIGLVIVVIAAAALLAGIGLLFQAFMDFKKGDQYGGGDWSKKLLAGLGLLGLVPLAYAIFKYLWSGTSLEVSLPSNPEDLVR